MEFDSNKNNTHLAQRYQKCLPRKWTFYLNNTIAINYNAHATRVKHNICLKIFPFKYKQNCKGTALVSESESESESARLETK